METEYVVLVETSGEECESWYYFISCKDNMDNLKYLQEQFDQIDWNDDDRIHMYNLDLTNMVSEKTAKEMVKLDLTLFSHHRKFDGKVSKIDFEFLKIDSNSDKLYKVFDKLAYGTIDSYISDEDVSV